MSSTIWGPRCVGGKVTGGMKEDLWVLWWWTAVGWCHYRVSVGEKGDEHRGLGGGAGGKYSELERAQCTPHNKEKIGVAAGGYQLTSMGAVR